MTNRRQFIKKAGVGIVGLGIVPAFAGMDQGWAFPTGQQGFPRSSPESQGVSSRAILDFIAACNASNISWHSFMLLRHGHVVAEGWWKPYEADFVHSLYSLSKSFTSTAIGLLVKEGKLDIHSPVISFFPNDLPEEVSANLGAMTVRSLLTMNTGHAEDTMPKMRASSDSWVKTYLSLPVAFAPGTHFLYNTGNTYMLGAIVHKITGQTLSEYLAPRLFQPLGITGYDWETSPQGLNTAGYGLRVKTEDIAKLGQLYLQKGVWKGTSILPAAWVAEATSAQTTSQVNNGDWSEGYGYQFWRCTHGFYRGDGAYGQFCIVMQEFDAVLAVTGQSPDMQKSMNIIWDHLLPGMKEAALPEDRGLQKTLKNELAGLALPVVKGAVASGLAVRYDGKRFVIDPNEMGVKTLELRFSAAGCRVMVEGGAAGAGVAGAGASDAGVAVGAGAAGAAGAFEDKKRTLDLGWEKWVVSPSRETYVFKAGDLFPMPSRIAGTATWVNDKTLQLNLRFVEGIFGDRITCEFEEDKIRVSFLNSVAETAVKKTLEIRKGLEGRVG
jgi:CubicO group peptidase (beta-lactamase class C family)